jgi:hypothetical protein
MDSQLASILIGTAGLDAGVLAALWLTLSRGAGDSAPEDCDRAVRVFWIGIALQSLHFGEEYFTQFYLQFPELLGLTHWSEVFFVTFNSSWIVIWILAALRMQNKLRAVLFAAWFLAIAMIMNGVVHPLLALRSDGYFPGLATSPFVGICGLILAKKLSRMTRAGQAEPSGPGRGFPDGWSP